MERLSKPKDWLCRHWKDVQANWRNTDDPMKLGLAWSKGFVALLFVLAFIPYSSGSAGWELKVWTLIKSRPNEIGDTLAGIAGALAFLWIIVTVQLQSKELRAQRQELELARNEYAKMAEAQGKQVELMAQQAETYRTEQKQNQEKQTEQLLDQVLEILANFYSEHSLLKWRSNYGKDPDGMVFIMDHELSLFDEKLVRGEKTVDELLIHQTKHMHEISDQLRSLSSRGELSSEFPQRSDARAVLWQIQQALRLHDQLSEAQRARLDKVGLYETQSEIEELMLLPFWCEEEPQK
ncbi:hypothetical protein XMM379_000197 [Aliiroseovarius sp. xm-m-379]|nr:MULTISPECIES: hypothetical protein [unclassified Aliiroseovarius]NRP14042.1 hypothetical protein [Aliiroseovarius sp. xm-d-517]NRP40858.1 hypothetical protein [Aliiroseovarius sp. xm-m-339-2]NRP62105.1 hypothetical protein [Aliiroseovarius sp. xm-a-151]NRQ06704.1 hypothetical protein [Aliiroseovarius sp. xm-v-201]NRP23526.1 hypothetical protein [Aliiroseovarius sp. xm-m-379]